MIGVTPRGLYTSRATAPPKPRQIPHTCMVELVADGLYKCDTCKRQGALLAGAIVSPMGRFAVPLW